MSDKTLDTVKLSVIENAINSIKKHYEDTPERLNDVEVSFEFIIGSFFPNVYTNLLDTLKEEHTLGYIEGIKERMNSEEDSVKILGLQKETKDIYKELLQIKKKIFYMGDLLTNASSFGWVGEPLEEQTRIYKTLELKINELIIYCQSILGLKLNTNAWENLNEID